MLLVVDRSLNTIGYTPSNINDRIGDLITSFGQSQGCSAAWLPSCVVLRWRYISHEVISERVPRAIRQAQNDAMANALTRNH